MFYSQGDIILLPFPFSDQSGEKTRPAIIISNGTINKTEDILCAAITTTVRTDEFSYPLNKSNINKPFKENKECEIRCHKLFLADKKLVKAKISSLKTGLYQEVYKIIIKGISPENSGLVSAPLPILPKTTSIA